MFRRRLPWFLFVLSLIINLAFLGGLLQAERLAERLAFAQEARAEVLSEQLGLTQSQRQALEALRQDVRQRLREIRAQRRAGAGARGSLRSEMVELLMAPEFDREELAALIDRATAQRREVWLDVGQEMHGFLQELTAEQRERFRALAESRGGLRLLMGGGRAKPSMQAD